MNSKTLLALVGLFTLPIAATAQTFTPVEVNPTGYVQAISNGIAAGSSITTGHAMLWSLDQATDVHPDTYLSSGIAGRNGNLSVGYAIDDTSKSVPMAWDGIIPRKLGVPFDYAFGRATATDGAQIVGSANPFDVERGIGVAHALLWTVGQPKVVDLGSKSVLQGVGGGMQTGYFLASKGAEACVWQGTSRSRINLHPKFADASVSTGTDGSIQVGYYGVDVRVRGEARPRKIRFYSAAIWSGSADSITNLDSTYRHTFALGLRGDSIVGYGNTTDAIGTPISSHAVAWVGANRTFVDLHTLLPATMRTSTATSVDEFGNIAGFGTDTNGQVHGLIWLRSA